MTDDHPAPRLGWQPHPDHPGRFGYFNGVTWSADVRDEVPADGAPPQLRPPASVTGSGPGAGGPVHPLGFLWAGIATSVVAGVVLYLALRNDQPVLVLLATAVGTLGTVLVLIGAAGQGALLALAHDRARRGPGA